MTTDPCRMQRRIWDAWLVVVVASFTAIELRALRHGCHPTLSRVLHQRHLGPALAAGGAVLAVHVIRYQPES